MDAPVSSAAGSSPSNAHERSLAPQTAQTLTDQITLSHEPHDEIAVRTPFNGEVLGHIPSCVAADVELAAGRARSAQPAWEARSFASRAAIFLRFHDLLLARQNEVLDLIQLESGKARLHAFEEVLDTAVVSRFYARHAERILRRRRRMGALPVFTRTWELRRPVGVVGFIVPWNYPLNIAVTDVLAALMAGNTAVLRPDPQASFTALWAIALLREAGMPWDVLQLVTGEGPAIGPALTERVDYLMFTGSTRTGRIVARQAAERLIGCSLELGGKNPMIVLADADMRAAVEGAARGCFVGAGQVCVSIERIYVQEPLFEQFVADFAARARRMKIGPALDYSTEMGTLTSERQLATVEEHVRDAIEKGATVVAGGVRRPEIGPLFYEPTILTGVREGMTAYADETFGPVVSVYPFSTEKQAIELANASAYGLNASIWTRDTRRGARLAQEIRAGSVNINEVYAAAWGSVDSPVGGMKQSGLRPRHGAEGILKFTESQTIAVQRLVPVAPPFGMGAAAFARLMTRLLALMKRTQFIG